jgi:hypothetical protein
MIDITFSGDNSEVASAPNAKYAFMNFLYSFCDGNFRPVSSG